MLRLRKILLSNYLYYTILVLILIITVVRVNIPKVSNYEPTSTATIATVIDYQVNSQTITLTIKDQNKEKLLVYYYLQAKDKTKENIQLGATIKVEGEFNKPAPNTIENTFNYQKYLSNKGILYAVKAKKIKIIRPSSNPYYNIKEIFKKLTKKNAYMQAFILGETFNINKTVSKAFQEIGISHLLAISGMHITLLSEMIIKTLKKLKVTETKRYYISIIIILGYFFLIKPSASALRGTLSFILSSINKIYYFYIKPVNIFILVLAITLLINPFYIYDIGFQYSFSISLGLIVMSNNLTGNYLTKLLKTSILSFLVSLPISLYNSFQMNLLSIIYNLIFVPYVNYIVFPLSIITFIFPFLLPLYELIITIFEKVTLGMNKITFSKLIFPKVSIFIYLLYYLIIIIILINVKKKKRKAFLILLIALIIHYVSPYFNNDIYVKIIDVGQGDSTLIHSKKETILVDTGGKLNYGKELSPTIVSNITIPLLKSLGIRKINTIILTHGDADHMGDASYLIQNYKVENVIFNNGEFNKLEKDLIEILDAKNIPYYSCVQELVFNSNKLYFLNNKVYDNENDNSIVLYTELYNYKFLLMGDASIKVEEDIMNKYNLEDIEFLKVGHHGSNTSSSKKFIDYVNPKYSLISVGKNNRYDHPKKSVLDLLNNSKIYRTDLDGSIEIKLNRNSYKISTCQPRKE